jgi:hypothetical protein
MVGTFLSDLARRGVSVRVADGRLAVRPTEQLTTNDRNVLRKCKYELLAYLAPPTPESWDLSAALDLMHQADGAVAESGVSGTHPEVQVVVNEVCSAYAKHDLAGVRFACVALRATVTRLALR